MQFVLLLLVSLLLSMTVSNSLRWFGRSDRLVSSVRTMATTKGDAMVAAVAQNVGKVGTYQMRHPGTCTGMYWRKDPRQGKATFSGPPDWPRNNAQLKGVVHNFKDKPENSQFWLEVSEYCQAGSTQWEKTPGAWMQFEQGGFLLHP